MNGYNKDTDLDFCEKSASCKNYCPYICDESCYYEPNEGTIEYEIRKLQRKQEPKPFLLDEDFAWKIYNFVNEWKEGKYGIVSLQSAIENNKLNYIITSTEKLHGNNN